MAHDETFRLAVFQWLREQMVRWQGVLPREVLGISPDYEVHVNRDLLLETDGPMLKHGIQELNGSRLVLPGSVAKRPDRERLARRYERFRRAG